MKHKKHVEIKTVIAKFFSISIVLAGCAKHEMQVSIAPKHFKTELHYSRTNDGIMLQTFWGGNKIEHDVLLDNHAPTWASNTIINGNKSIHQITDVGYKTTTGEGTGIKGEVYVCDSIFLGETTFKRVTLYKIADEENLVKHKTSTGALGGNVMAAGIWKIDFKKRLITVASDLDSITIKKADKIPAKFDGGIISIETETVLVGSTNQIFELDLGFNLTCLVPLKDFNVIFKDKQESFSSSLSTPAGSTTITGAKAFATLKIGTGEYRTLVLTHASAQQNLIGLLFFEQFDFIVLDYINKAFYVSKS